MFVALLRELVVRWEAQAQALERYAPAAAAVFTDCAAQLRLALDDAATEALTLEQAAAESGYSVDYLGELVRDGRVLFRTPTRCYWCRRQTAVENSAENSAASGAPV